MRSVEVGLDVVGLDSDKRRVDLLASGESFVEDISNERLRAALDTGRYLPTTNPDDSAEFDVAVISVPTPLREGVPDLSFIEDAVRDLAPHLRVGATVILESTTWPGTTEEFVAPILEGASGLTAGREFHLGYSPERIDPGNTVWTFETTPKVVSGVTKESLYVIRRFYDQLVDETVPVPTPKEAELTKLLENTFRHVNVALVNELAMFAGDLGIDIWATIDAAATKPFGFMRFTPGPGVGGHCLPIDPSYLSWRVKRTLGHSFRFVELANDVNDHMPDYVVRRLTMALNKRKLPVHGRRILVLGLAYKRNTGDARESPSLPVCRTLVTLGAEVRVADPHVPEHQFPSGVHRVEYSKEEIAAADAVVLLVAHNDFDPDLLQDNARYVLDAQRVLSPAPHVELL
jgi:UDP-N-acetyl-D-glucosamine dehydrogenase